MQHKHRLLLSFSITLPLLFNTACHDEQLVTGIAEPIPKSCEPWEGELTYNVDDTAGMKGECYRAVIESFGQSPIDNLEYWLPVDGPPMPLPDGCEDLEDDGLDVFGITEFFATKKGSLPWDSSHWSNGVDRSLSSGNMAGKDPLDPTLWSEYRGDGDLHIDGQGVLTMSGRQPRLYINPYADRTTENPEQFFKNVEITVYYRRTGTDGANWGGLIVGARSGPNGHSSFGDYCDATTQYARFRHDGLWDFEKEIQHPSATYWGEAENKHGVLFADSLTADRWIGMKYIVRNVADGVQFDLYIDTKSNGDIRNGGQWEAVSSLTDSGQWESPSVGCGLEDNFIISEGGGVVFIRNTDIAKAEYKYFSVREIE